VIPEEQRRWWVLGALGGVLAMVVLDEVVVGVALPTIQNELGMSLVGSHWVVNAYLLVFTIFAAAGGKLLDLAPIHRVVTAAAILFGVASIACGLAPNGPFLLAARAVQGLGSAVLFPACVAMVPVVFPPDQRGTAFGIQTAIAGTFLTLSPLIGGLFTEFISWRWVFFINVPVVLAVLTILSVAWKEPVRELKRGIDLPGLLTFLIGLGGIVVGLMQGPDWGWTDPATLIPLGIGVIGSVGFVVLELRAGAPLIDLPLFAKLGFTMSNLVVFTGQFLKFAVVVFAVSFLQEVAGASAFEAGVIMLIAVLPSVFAAVKAGRIADRFGPRRPILVGVLVHGLAVGSLGLLAGFANPWLFLPSLVLWGASMPLMFVPPRRLVMSEVDKSQQGQAGGLTMTSQLTGGTVGMAICSAVLALTGSYAAIFFLSGGLALGMFLLALALLPRSG